MEIIISIIKVFKVIMGTDKLTLRELKRKKRAQDNTQWKSIQRSRREGEAAASDARGKPEEHVVIQDETGERIWREE